MDILKPATLFIAFQCLEHIQEDLKVLQALSEGCKCFISVPNSKYPGHIRWFELDGWRNRFKKYIDFDEIVTIQNPRKVNKRSFLFKGIRNGYKD